jgi:mycothiol system anti-sigma-R factor
MAKCGPECEETLQEIERFLDHEVDDVIRAKVEHHLSGCNDCTDKATFRVHLKALIQVKCAEHEIPDGLKDRLRTLLSSADPSLDPR